MPVSIPVKTIAEFLGTFFLMLVTLASGGSPLMVGGALVLIMFLIGSLSGGAVNPALALGSWYNGSLSTRLLTLYIVAEALGAVAAVWAYKVVA